MIFKYVWQPVLIQRILFGFEVILIRSWLKNHFRESFLAKQSIQNKRRKTLYWKRAINLCFFALPFLKTKSSFFYRSRKGLKLFLGEGRYLHHPNNIRPYNLKNTPPLKKSLILKTKKERGGGGINLRSPLPLPKLPIKASRGVAANTWYI